MSKYQQPVDTYWLGSVPYQEAWGLQKALVTEVLAGRRPDTLLLLEHPHVFTFGRRGSADHLLWDEAERRRRQVDVIWCDRGGDATYHGPGQLVGYPILDLSRHGADVLLYLRRLEDSLVDYLMSLGLEATVAPGFTGVWSGGPAGAATQGRPAAKVAAIGVKLTRSVVSHGFALNLTTDLGYFDGIVPCGLAGKQATSVVGLGGAAIHTETAASAYSASFARTFEVALEWPDLSRLPALPQPEVVDAVAASPAGRSLPVL